MRPSLNEKREIIARSGKSQGDNFTDQESTGKDKKVLPPGITFRNQEIISQPCMPGLSGISDGMSGSENTCPGAGSSCVDDLLFDEGQSDRESRDIRLEVQNLLTAISEHDQFLNHIEREVVDNCIMVLDHARDRERKVYEKAAEMRKQDIERINRIGGDPGSIPPLEVYVIQRGMA